MPHPLTFLGRWWRLALLRLALAVPMAPWLILLSLWADSEWARTAAFNGGRPAPSLQTMLVIPGLCLVVLVIDALVAATLLRPWLVERIGLTRSAGLLFWRWLAAGVIVALLVAIVMRATPGGPLIFGLSAVAGCGLFALIVLLRARGVDEDLSQQETGEIPRIARADDRLPPLRAPATHAAPAPSESTAAFSVVPIMPCAVEEQVHDPAVWIDVATRWAATLPALQAHGVAEGDWLPLARARAEAATLLGRGALPFDDDAADCLAVAIDAFRAAANPHQLRQGCRDLLELTAPRALLGPG